MPAYAIIGAQWGDEGKGKIVDMLAERSAVVARFSGGNNAGHTIIRGDNELKLHLVPCGVAWPQVTNVIGNGMVVDVDVLQHEVQGLADMGFRDRKIVVSDRAHLIMPYHILLDQLQENQLGEDAIGTTRRGIGPAYVDKVSRVGVRAGELLDLDLVTERVLELVRFKNRLIKEIYHHEPIAEDEVVDKIRNWAQFLTPYVGKAEDVVADTLAADGNVIFEGAQGALLDLDHGTYPYVTSSNCTIGGVLTGLGMGPRSFSEVAGVFKAYCTRVGAGPLPTELEEEAADALRQRSGEFGSTTGRPRRIGWFDAVAGHYSAVVNGMNSIIITRLDILDGMDKVPICVAYKLNGETITRFPQDPALLGECEPVYEYLPGWSDNTAGITTTGQLPTRARDYIERLAELVGAPVKIVSTGPEREQAVQIEQLIK